MRSLSLSIVVFFLFSGLAFAAQFGAPVVATEVGDMAVAAGYSHLSSDWDVNNSAEFKDTKTRMRQYFAQLDLGLAEGWRAYVRTGLASLEADYVFEVGGSSASVEDFENGPVPFGSVGLNGKLVDGDTVDLGLVVQATYFDTFDDKASAASGVTIQSNVDSSAGAAVGANTVFDKMWMLDIGLEFEAIVEGVSVYGGPVLYFGQTEVQSYAYGFDQVPVGATNPVTGELIVASTFVDDLRETGYLGLNLGARWMFDNGVRLDVEFEKRSNFNVGFLVSYDF